jgi:hypothetical protein
MPIHHKEETLIATKAHTRGKPGLQSRKTRPFRRTLLWAGGFWAVACLAACGGGSSFSSGATGSSASSSASSSSSSSSGASSGSASSSGSSTSSASSSGSNARADFIFTVSGLDNGATLVLLLNGTYPQLITQNTADGGEEFFTIGTPQAIVTLPVGVSYTVTVGTQPTGQTCVLANASGTSALDNPVVAVTCADSSSNGMSSSLRQTTATKNEPAALLPRARQGAASWSDAAADLWLFGGQSTDSSGIVHLLGDLWKYDSSSRIWVRISGLGAPAERSYAATWTDSAGTLWIFGWRGVLPNGALVGLGDLWRFEPSAGVWTRINLSSQPAPSARMSAASWLDSSGNLWLFGGYGEMAAGATGQLNDLWRYSPAANSWEQQSATASQ